MRKKFNPRFRIDDNVFISMGLLCLLAIGVLAFRYSTHKPCKPVPINITAAAYEAGTPIHVTTAAKQCVWNFGDNSPEEHGASAIHTYKAAGKYTLVATVNGHCVEVHRMVIKDPALREDGFRPVLLMPDTAYVNRPVTFIDSTPNATTWQWKFGETGLIDATGKTPVYIYKTPGVKTIALTVNGRMDKTILRTLYIKDHELNNNSPKSMANQRDNNAFPKNDRPAGQPAGGHTLNIPKEPKAKAPEITNEALAEALQQVITGQKTAADFAPYMCGDTRIMVLYNGASLSFEDMCAKLKEFKKEKKASRPNVLQIIDGATGCIKTLNVTVKKKGLLNRIF
jgi:hypothetical protein